jgi:hypothetical protein
VHAGMWQGSGDSTKRRTFSTADISFDDHAHGLCMCERA